MWTVLASIAFLALVPPTIEFGVDGSGPSGYSPEVAPGDALGLDHRSVRPDALPTSLPAPSGARVPVGAVGAASLVALAAAGLGSLGRRRDDAPMVVVVHGNGGSPRDFDGLIRAMGIEDDRVVAFDWRTAGEGATSTAASRVAPTAVASRELELLLRQLSETHSNIYTIHHSKGGAVGVDLIGRLDAGVREPIDGYRGAALLDPAISRGPLGWIQRIGRIAPFIPDNGGFDPVVCSADGCTDLRADLGEASGVEVIAVRNPDAVLTNFPDSPKGLRVYDLVDDGGSSAYASMLVPPRAWMRMFEAHRSVLHSPAVAECLKAEIEAVRSCVWAGSWTPRIGWRGGGASRPRVL